MDMMTKHKLTAIFLLVSLLVCFAVAGYASKGDELMAKADKAFADAKTATRTSDIQDNANTAFDIYTRIAKDTDYYGPLGATALYKLYEVQTMERIKQYSLYNAHLSLKQLINQYGQEVPVLKQRLTDSEIEQVQQIVATAREKQLALEKQIDHQNKTEGIYGVLYTFIDSLVALTGRRPGFSYWFALILITVIVKIITTPLTKKQYQNMKEMQAIAPLLKELQEKYKGDQKTIGEKTMELYREHNINPFASCLPLLIQMPILMMVFYTIKAYEFQLQNGSFAWIGSEISHKWHQVLPMWLPNGGTSIWFTAKNLSEPDVLLVVLYLVSMYFSTKMSSVDPSQAEQQKMMAVMMPLMFAFIFAGYPSAFLLYWLTLNILQTAQQWLIMRQPAPVLTTQQGSVPPPESEGGSDQQRRRPRRRR